MKHSAAAVILLGLFAAGPWAEAQGGLLTDALVSLDYPGSHWSGAPLASLWGADPAGDPLFHMGLWYRAQGDAREWPLPAPDTETYSGASLHAVWNNLDGKGFTVDEYTQVFDHEGPSGALVTIVHVVNNNPDERSFSLFHYLDAETGGTLAGDSGQLVSSGFLKFTDGAAVVRYRADGADHYQVGAPTAVRGLLNDGAISDLADTGVPFGPGDVSAAWQATRTLGSGHRMILRLSVSSRLPRDHVRAAPRDLYPFSSLLAHAADVDVYEALTMRRTSQVLGYGWYLYPPAGHDLLALDDFDGDAHDELLSRDRLTGEVRLDGLAVAGVAALPLNWKFAATGDFDGDGRADILWRNVTSQKLVIWLMDGNLRSGVRIPNPDQAVDANWEVAGAADFDSDGDRDLLWYNRTSGRLVLWYLDGAAQRTGATFTTPNAAGDANWRVVAVGDYGRGAAGPKDATDIVWQNTTSRRVVVWHMDGATRVVGTFTSPATVLTDGFVVGPR